MVLRRVLSVFVLFFFFNDTATTEIYTLSLHDALPISFGSVAGDVVALGVHAMVFDAIDFHRLERADADVERDAQDRKSTRLNSSHSQISYAVFCLKKKKKQNQKQQQYNNKDTHKMNFI